VQYTGNGATHEIEAFHAFMRAYTTDSFRTALQHYDTGSQSWAWADIDGNIAHFTSGEIPLREDLQTMSSPDGGVPPFLIRDGAHSLRHEWMPATSPDPHRALAYEILPFEEMPQSVNPARGWLLAANNDHSGSTFDNQPLNQMRPGGGISYLGRSYAPGLRAARIAERVEAELATDGMSVDEARAIQADNVLHDAERFVPFIIDAWSVLGPTWPDSDAATMAEAVDLLAKWDFTTPTGLAAGYDLGEDLSDQPEPTSTEINNSVAAAIYAMWRSKVVKRVIDDPLQALGGLPRPGSGNTLIALGHLFAEYPANAGAGASGLQLIPGGDLDTAVLDALSDALAELAGPAMKPVFGGATALDDYRWGRLHRVVFDHPLGGQFNIPEAGGFSDFGIGLPGIARSGGFATVDAASHSIRADGPNEFMFGSGAARRSVSHLLPTGIEICDVIPGGASGLPASPHFADQLPMWLTHQCRPELLAPMKRTLEVQLVGTGSGSVTSTPSGIDCGDACSASFGWGEEIVLAATADPGSEFVGFAGDPDCADGALTLTTDASCTAEFLQVGATVSASKTVTGEFLPGGVVTYTIVLTNDGPGDQGDNPGHELTDVLSDSLELIGASTSSGLVTADLSTRTVTWNGSLASSSHVSIVLEARVALNATGTVVNQAVVSYDSDGDGSNETSVVTDDPTTQTALDSTSFLVETVALPPETGPRTMGGNR
jgi:uncharacterized repeat protein (TIGR01451 family)